MIRAESAIYSKALPARGNQMAASRELKLTLLIAVAHVPLGLLLYRIGFVAILHPIAVFFIGMYWATNRRYKLERVGLAVAYIVGAEVLWRMAQVPILWEFGKYGSAAIMTVALVTRRRFTIPKFPLIFFLSLIPACFLTLTVFDPEKAQAHLSFNMSGPLLLVVACWFFSSVQISVQSLRRVLFAIIIPLLSVAFVTLFYSLTTENLEFSTESNVATSGGFGPNQVSSMLGLGILLSAGCVVLFKNRTQLKVTLGAVAVLFTAQSVLTFSRGGIYNALGGLLILVLFHFKNFADGLKRLLPIVAFGALFYWFVFPALDNFTGGKLVERFEETGTTNRVDIIQSDLNIFLENPLFGVGPGVSSDYRRRLWESAASHTEFSRLISEHGTLGLIAILCLFAILVTNLIRQRSTLGRALVAGVSVWAILFMFNAGMRLAAPAFMWGLTFISIGTGRDRRSVRMRKPRPITPRQLGVIPARKLGISV